MPTSEVKWDRSGLKEACQRGLSIGRTHQEFGLQLLLDMLLEIERLEGELQHTYADGFCARCSRLAYPLTRALEQAGVPTGADDWQQTYGPNKVRALADLGTCLRRLLLALDEGDPEEIKSRVEWAKRYIELHAAIRRRLTALAQEEGQHANQR